MKQTSSDSSKKNQQLIDQFDYLGNAASAQDCTGLIPWLPSSSFELESYEEVCRYQSPAAYLKQKDASGNSHI